MLSKADLKEITESLGLWSAVVMVPNKDRTSLVVDEHYNLPPDWVGIKNPLNLKSLNAQAFNCGKTMISNRSYPQPLGTKSAHSMTAVTVFPLKQNNKIVATLELIADTPGYQFTTGQINQLKDNLNQNFPALNT